MAINRNRDVIIVMTLLRQTTTLNPANIPSKYIFVTLKPRSVYLLQTMSGYLSSINIVLKDHHHGENRRNFPAPNTG